MRSDLKKFKGTGTRGRPRSSAKIPSRNEKPPRKLDGLPVMIPKDRLYSSNAFRQLLNFYRDYVQEQLVANEEILPFKRWFLEVHSLSDAFPTPRCISHKVCIENFNKWSYNG